MEVLMQTKSPSTFYIVLTIALVVLYVLSLGMFLYANAAAGDGALWQLLTSGLILSIPLILLYGLLGILIIAARQRSQGGIAPRLARIIYWSPRIAAILIIFFISLFALDVFEGDYSLGEMLLAFLMHMIPSLVLIVLLIIAWRWEWFGALAFLAGGLFFLRTLFLGFGEPGALSGAIGMFLLFAGPLFLIALLFGANWRWHAELHPPAAS